MSLLIDKTGRINSSARASHLPPCKKAIVELRVADRLKRSPYPEIRSIACEFYEGMLFLRGCVTSYYLKQIAQTIVLEMGGFEKINNQLEVLTLPLAGERSVLLERYLEPNGLDYLGGGIFHKEDV